MQPLGNILADEYNVDNMIKIVDNMYQRAVHHQMAYNVNRNIPTSIDTSPCMDMSIEKCEGYKVKNRERGSNKEIKIEI